ncbi:hypothetical protein NEOC95_001010 [Neochlamydia sp. AcF95]|nr:hypothetical protein [Neochlamydia sp. AcF95]
MGSGIKHIFYLYAIDATLKGKILKPGKSPLPLNLFKL